MLLYVFIVFIFAKTFSIYEVWAVYCVYIPCSIGWIVHRHNWIYMYELHILNSCRFYIFVSFFCFFPSNNNTHHLNLLVGVWVLLLTMIFRVYLVLLLRFRGSCQIQSNSCFFRKSAKIQTIVVFKLIEFCFT